MSSFSTGVKSSIESPAESAFAVTPSDTVELTTFTRALYIGGAGDVAAVMVDGSEATFVGLLAGQVLPVRVRQVKSTGTDASNIVGLV